jgi:predicted nucleotidyltransferase
MADESWLEPKSPQQVDAILEELRSGLDSVYGERLRGLYLYGSYARGEARRGSDLDVLIVLDRLESSWDELKRSGHITSAMSLEHDLTISRAFVSEDQWRRAEIPLVRNVRREGRAA